MKLSMQCRLFYIMYPVTPKTRSLVFGHGYACHFGDSCAYVCVFYRGWLQAYRAPLSPSFFREGWKKEGGGIM